MINRIYACADVIGGGGASDQSEPSFAWPGLVGARHTY